MEAYGNPEGQQIYKIRAKYGKSTDPKTQQKKVTIQDPPKPEKVVFYYSKTHVFKDPPYPEKVTKMTPKCPPNDLKIDPIAPKSPSKTFQKTNRQLTSKKDSKILKK